MRQPEISIVIPAFNEQERIGVSLKAIRRHFPDPAETEIIVVCDGCTDQTQETVDQSGFDAQVISYSPNQGKGYAVKRGVLESSGKIIAYWDADGATPIGELDRIAAPIRRKQAEIVIASRHATGAHITTAQPISRRILGMMFRIHNRIVLGLPFGDTQCGCKVFHGDVAHTLFAQLQCPGFAFDLELLMAAYHEGFRIKECGVEWSDISGTTVNPLKDGWTMLCTAWNLRLNRASRNNAAMTAVLKTQRER